jgi:hypothetical protein
VRENRRIDATIGPSPADDRRMRVTRHAALLTLSSLLLLSLSPAASSRERASAPRETRESRETSESPDGDAPAIPYPQGWRDWSLVKTSLVVQGHAKFETEGGFHHTFANPKGLAGFRTGTFEDGAVIVAETIASKEIPGSVVVEADRRRIDIMVRDSKRFPTTGGWGWQQFRGTNDKEGTVTDSRAATCFACHQNLSPKTLVIGIYRP